MYFSKFPQGNYDLSGNGNEKLVTDLMRRVKVRAKITNEEYSKAQIKKALEIKKKGIMTGL